MSFKRIRRSSLSRNSSDSIFFSRRELGEILPIYGRMVAAGQWRDYGISSLRNAAVFSIFRNAFEMPIYRIEKRPQPAYSPGNQNGTGKEIYSLIGMDGRVIRRSSELRSVLRVLDRKLIRIVR